MSPGYCPVCGGRVGVIRAGIGPVGAFGQHFVDMPTMTPHRCDADAMKAMARLYDTARAILSEEAR